MPAVFGFTGDGGMQLRSLVDPVHKGVLLAAAAAAAIRDSSKFDNTNTDIIQNWGHWQITVTEAQPDITVFKVGRRDEKYFGCSCSEALLLVYRARPTATLQGLVSCLAAASFECTALRLPG
jgi:hypothetical protein